MTKEMKQATKEARFFGRPFRLNDDGNLVSRCGMFEVEIRLWFNDCADVALFTYDSAVSGTSNVSEPVGLAPAIRKLERVALRVFKRTAKALWYEVEG